MATEFIRISPQRAAAIDVQKNGSPVSHYQNLVKHGKGKRCVACNNAPAWALVETDMCFQCTTGESDASKDFELEGV